MERKKRRAAYRNLCLLWLCCGMLWMSRPAVGFWGTLFPCGIYEREAETEKGGENDRDRHITVRFKLLELLQQWFAADK